MRLLNTRSLHFTEFLGDDVPPYAILSHVWSRQELRHEDFLAGWGKDLYGYEKIIKLCERACGLGTDSDATPLEYCWIDTICIDKRSSAELTEAINSMHVDRYSWYEKAKVCFVFLPDVDALDPEALGKDGATASQGAPFYEYQFLESKWFKRGFTLQELIAPQNVLFFNTAYQIIGQKGVVNNGVRPLTDLVEKASGISISGLLGRLHNNPRGACIAQKMSWASKRQTTRPEDIAYCLLGIFEVNMPLLYGEGARDAFRRLQEAIIARSTDESIFAWDTEDPTQPWSGLLAPHPRVFWNCGDMYTVRSRGPKIAATYAVTQRGVELVMPMEQAFQPSSTATWCTLYPLTCFRLRQPWFNCYLKIWIEGITMDGRRYADGCRLAWRSGIITLEYHDPGMRDLRLELKAAVERKALTQALGGEEPGLLEFNDTERELHQLTLQYGLGVSRGKQKKWRVRQSVLKILGAERSSEPNLVKLYFKTHFTVTETPIATALLRRPT